VGWWIVAGCGAGVLALGVITTGRPAKRTAERTASRIPAHTGTRNDVDLV
jgi:hypothetical protein